MNVNEYQKQCLTTADYPVIGARYIYPAIGLSNEAGEILGKLKKVFRDDGGILSEEKRNAIKDEIGDCTWCCATLAHDLGFTLEEVLQRNIEKLENRKQRGVINGSGDNR